MKARTAEFKETIKKLGREIDCYISYTDPNTNTGVVLDNTIINSVSPHYEGSILKSVMKVLDIDCNEDIPLETEISFKFGVKVRNNVVEDYRDNYDYIEFGNYIVYKSEKQEDTKSYKITCYDKMLYSMKEYETPQVSGTPITYPITIRDYLSAICSHIGLTFANVSDTFANYDKQIASELFLDSNGNSIGYTFRDVLDQLAEVTAGTICINSDDELEIRYVEATTTQTLSNYLANIQYTAAGITITSTASNNKITLNGTCAGPFEKNIGGIRVKKGEKYRVAYSGSGITPSYSSYRATLNIVCGENTISMPLYNVSTVAQFTSLIDGYAYINVAPKYNGTYTNYQAILTVTHYVESVDNIDEEYLKDVNVNFGEIYGPINTIVLSRSAGADNIYYPSTLPANPIEIKITDNQIMNGNDRDTYMQPIYNKLNGLSYYVNDFSSTGITYLDLLDKYKVIIGDKVYNCLMLNDDIQITTGLEENIYTERPEESVTDYTKADSTDIKLNQASIIVDKKISEVDIRGKTINMTADNIKIDSTYFKVNESGDVIANSLSSNNASITGGNLTITQDAGATSYPIIVKKTLNGVEYVTNYNANGINATVGGNTVFEMKNYASGYYPYFRVQNASNNSTYTELINDTITLSYNGDEAVSINSSQYGGSLEVCDSGGNVSAEIIGSTGNMYANNFVPNSRESIKKNIEPYKNALNEVLNTDIYKYNLKIEEDNDKKHVGFVIGSNRKYSKDITAIRNDEETGADLYSMVSVLWQAVKEQQEIIEDLEKRIQEIEKK